MKKLAQSIKDGGNKQSISFILCILLAAFIWVINSLNNSHTSEVTIPIIYDKEIEKNSAHPLPPSVHLEVKGRGFKLWSFKKAAKKYSIQTSYLSSRAKDTVISSKEALFSLLNDFNKDIEITGVQPAQLIFSGFHFQSKKLAVKGSYKLEFNAPFMQSGPSVYYPDSVTVYSNNKIPESLNEIYAETIHQKKIHQKVFRRVQLIKPNSEYRLLQNEAWLYVPVEEGTEIELEVPLQTQHGELLIPSQVRLTCLTPLSKYNQMHPSLFRIRPRAEKSTGDKVIVEVSHAPYWVSRVQIEPVIARRLMKFNN